MTPLTPATVLTGFLGAGKSTLLRRILTEPHGLRIAVIENEFGEENIDSEIIVSGGDEHIVKLSNGCVCCGIRDDLRATLADLAKRRSAGEIPFDYLIMETTGLADPGPIAQTFFLDFNVAQCYRLDGVVTLVDAKHATKQLDTRAEARRQVGYADRLFVTKGDLVDSYELEALTERLRCMNPRAPRRLVAFGDVPIEDVLDLGAFNLNAELDIAAQSVCSETCSDKRAHHHHDDDVKSFVFRSSRPFDPMRFGQFMNTMIRGFGPALFRYKGVLNFAGLDRKVIFQGVHELTSHHVGDLWQAGEERLSRLVFIGLELPQPLILRSLEQCLL